MPGSPQGPRLDELLGTLGALSGKLTGRDGDAIREHLQQLAVILASQGDDRDLRRRAADELEQLIAALAGLAGLRGAAAKAMRGFDLGKLADGLRAFVAFLRAPTSENQAQVEQLVAELRGEPALQPVPLDELRIDQRVEALAIESARRHGLRGAEQRRAIERMKREMTGLVRQLEQRAQQEAARAQTASEMERLFDSVIQTGTPLGAAIAPERAALIAAFRSVDLAHMADGLREFALWLSSPSDDAAAHAAALRARLAGALGPPTAGDPARSEAERRADFEREIQAAVERIFGATRPS